MKNTRIKIKDNIPNYMWYSNISGTVFDVHGTSDYNDIYLVEYNGNVMYVYMEDCVEVDENESDTHYDNSNGSIYKFATDQQLNSWEFDIIKRVTRCRKKGQFKEDLEKTKRVIDLYLKEYNDGGRD
jgi:hypothetical protein